MSGAGEWLLSLLRSTLSTTLTLAMVAGAVLSLFGAYAIVSLHVATVTVLTGSMRGTYDPGDLLIVKPKPVSSVAVGDVILFTPPGETVAYTHRVVTVTAKGGQRVVTTKGDANPSPDRWKAVLQGQTVPYVVGRIPKAGGVLLVVQRSGARTPLLALLGLVIAVSGTRLILGSSRPGQQHPQHAHPVLAKELIPCPSTPLPPLRPASTARVPSPRPPSESVPLRSPVPASTRD